jgi:hypothetical protein
MPRTRPLISPLFLAAIVALLSTQAAAQELRPTGLWQWDSTNQVLFFDNCYPGSVVRAYADGHQRGADIDIRKDFPGIQECYVETLTAGPDGTTLIAVVLNFGNDNIQQPILTYDSLGKLLRSWDPAPQYVEAMAYSKEDDALFILGGRDLPHGPDAPNYPLLIEYSRDGRALKVMVPAGSLKEGGGDSFHQNGEHGQPALRITKSQIYFYAPTNREAVIIDRNGVVLAYRSLSDIVEKMGMEDGYHLVQVHAVDFTDDGDVVLELLLGNDIDYSVDVFRINIKSGEVVPVHKSFNDGGRLWFVGLKDGQYVYIEKGQRLVIQSAEAQEPLPLASNLIR